MRLSGGLHRCEGRVELYQNGAWGTVCDDAWDLPDAQVVCRLLGCGDAIAAHVESFFGPGAGTILLDNVKCTGTELSLWQCSHIPRDVHNCDHSEDAGVTCSLTWLHPPWKATPLPPVVYRVSGNGVCRRQDMYIFVNIHSHWYAEDINSYWMIWNQKKWQIMLIYRKLVDFILFMHFMNVWIPNTYKLYV